MSGRAGRTGFDTRGDAIVICTTKKQVDYTRDTLLQPFQAKLTSALSGPRLVRSLLEIIASQVVGSLPQIAIFIKSTLVYELAELEKCAKCHDDWIHNQVLFGEARVADTEKEEKKSPLEDFVSSFDIAKFVDSQNGTSISDDSTNYSCKNCIF